MSIEFRLVSISVIFPQVETSSEWRSLWHYYRFYADTDQVVVCMVSMTRFLTHVSDAFSCENEVGVVFL